MMYEDFKFLDDRGGRIGMRPGPRWPRPNSGRWPFNRDTDQRGAWPNG